MEKELICKEMDKLGWAQRTKGIVIFLAGKATFCKVQCITVSFRNKLQTNFGV